MQRRLNLAAALVHEPRTIGRGARTTRSMFAVQDVMLRDGSLAQVSGEIVFLLAYGIASL